MEEASEFLDSSDFDLDYEFDAPKFFDFTSLELPSQAAETERWFLFANTYPPSPLIIKLKWRTEELEYGGSSTCNSTDPQREDACNHSTDVSMGSEDTPRGNGSQKSANKSQLRPYLPRSSTLLKPTASHLAKLGASPAKSNGRTQNPASPMNHSGDAIATKRQKLENGYLKKAAQLRHQSSFSHKSSKKVTPFNSASTPIKPKVTVPKGPMLETHCRARRFRSMKATCQGDTKISKHCTFKALPLNRKIFESPLLAQPKKSTPCLPEFQEFHLRTAERAMHNSSDNVGLKLNSSDNEGLSIKQSPLSPQSPEYDNSSEDVVYRFKSEPEISKDFKLSGDKKCEHNPPAELFSKMSLTSDNHPESQKQYVSPKESKENLPNTLAPNGTVGPSKSPRCNVKNSQFGGVKAITDPAFTRSYRIY